MAGHNDGDVTLYLNMNTIEEKILQDYKFTVKMPHSEHTHEDIEDFKSKYATLMDELPGQLKQKMMELDRYSICEPELVRVLPNGESVKVKLDNWILPDSSIKKPLFTITFIDQNNPIKFLKLFIRTHNLFLVGFQNASGYYDFNDSKIKITPATCLGYSGGYYKLLNARQVVDTNSMFEGKIIDVSSFFVLFGKLWNGTDATHFPKPAIFAIILFFIEALRFKYIEEELKKAMNNICACQVTGSNDSPPADIYRIRPIVDDCLRKWAKYGSMLLKYTHEADTIIPTVDYLDNLNVKTAKGLADFLHILKHQIADHNKEDKSRQRSRMRQRLEVKKGKSKA